MIAGRVVWIAAGVALALAARPAAAQRPSIFLSSAEGATIRRAAPRLPLLAASLAAAQRIVDTALAHPIDVPQPGEAGSYAHERHKQNYREMQLAGELYRITDNARYAAFVRDMLEKYAVLYPTLPANPYARDQAPGKLFHQALNEANWLVATAIAYDCVYDFLEPAERARFERNIFHPMADWLSVTQAKEFDRIHNHGTWAAAAVGMIGYVMHDTAYVNRAIYGTKHNGTGGFLRQLDLLFSPDGYYMEGPYYVRYALMPFFYFAEAIDRNQPQFGIYQYRGGILKKALHAALATTYPNGVFPPINDASRMMDVRAPEAVVAVDLGYAHYAPDDNLLAIAAMQHEVALTGGGLHIARDLAVRPTPPRATWESLELTDGPDGREGGLGVLRSGSGADATMLLMKYGVHGQGHGHFDKLHFTFFDDHREVVPDYGFARWINVEPKFGGRYLPENESYAKQTIAHNTVVVDETSQSNGNYRLDETRSAQRHFFDARDPSMQVMSATANGFYDGVGMERTMFLVRDTRLPDPVVIDLYRLRSNATHTYDYPLHFRGQIIATNVRYTAHTATQQALGTGAGYQHIWNEADGRVDGPVQLTWLDGHRYYTATTAAGSSAELFVGRTGAGDPNFDLRSEPMMIVRQHGTDQLFASVIEPHGYFSEREERSDDAAGQIQSVRVLGTTADASAVEVTGAGGLRWVVLVNDGPASVTAHHEMTIDGARYDWTGNAAVQGLKER